MISFNAGNDKEPCDFLAPPQGADELGRLGSYRILRVLGQGGMGVVFLAEDTHLERKVALKAMKPALATSDSAKKRFLREAKAAASIKHDHIVTIYQVGEDQGVPFLAMELLEGESLDDRIKREGKLSIAEAVRIGKEVAEGLAQAHEQGLIHRDIKPANIWLDSTRNRVKILDFGLARAVHDETHLTKDGAIIGTPAYMAPEQARGEPVDCRCDLFSLGCVLYRLCTGQLPFRGKDTIGTLMAVTMDMPKTPIELNGDVPLALSELVMKLLAKEKTERPYSAGAVIAQLKAIEGRQIQTYTPPLSQQLRSASSRQENQSETVAYDPQHSSLPEPRLRPGRRKAYYAAGAVFFLLILYGVWVVSKPLVKIKDGQVQRLEQGLIGTWLPNESPPPMEEIKGIGYKREIDSHVFRIDGTLTRYLKMSGRAETIAYEVVDGNHILLGSGGKAERVRIVLGPGELTIFYNEPEGIRRFLRASGR